jgi:diadenosine tetraphosphate (Ap4A) HIT family hydrolase
MECLFCKIIAGKEKAWIVYEDDHHVGFLTPFPNTPGFTVLVTREHLDSDVLAMEGGLYTEFVRTAQRVAQQMNEKLHTK